MESGSCRKNENVTRRPRGRPKIGSDDARRADIISEARETFYELGYGNATMERVAMRCKISKQTLYRLFSSKTDLFMAIITAHRESMLALPRDPDETLPLADTLSEIFMIEMPEEMERHREAFIHFILRESQQFPEVAALLTTHGVQHSRTMLADWLRTQHERGRIMAFDSISCARMLMDMVFGAIAELPLGSNDWPNRKARNDHLRQCFHVFLNGVQPPERRCATERHTGFAPC